jgi:hypothetical protein
LRCSNRTGYKLMANRDYLDFELNVEALVNNRLRVTVTSSPVGSVSIESTNPFTPDEIAQIVALLEGSEKVSRAELNKAARDFGEKLFNTVFSGQVYAAYLASVDRAGEVGLRIRLGLDDAGFLGEAPWELLRDPRGDYLALSRQTPVVRYPRVLTVRPLVRVSLPLRVLVMISSPADQDQLDVEAEWQALQDATADLRARNLLELTRLDDAQLVTLQRKLREGTDFQVFHFIGHAAFDDKSQSGMLAFEDPKTGNTMPVSGEALARELSEENSIRLVVLNACHAARANKTDPFAGIASSAVARGLPAVVAMQFAITDNASRLFAQEFYKAISEGYPIEAAIAEARRAISSTLNNFEWVTPVLYLRAPTGVLFPRRTTSERTSTGGIREAMRSPIGVIISLMVVGIIVAAGALFTRPAPIPPPTLTPTPVVRDVDLVVTSLRFVPPNPVPGQHVTVALTITNNGSTDTGPFKWGWFVKDPQDDPNPSIVNEVANLSPGIPLNVKGDFFFGLWGTYITTAWVNFDGAVPETNFINNLKVRPAITSDAPMVVDFTVLPSGEPLVQQTALKGDEFVAWGLQLAPGPGDPGCADAKLQLFVNDNINRIRPGRDGSSTDCSNLPIVFNIDQPIGSASVQFFAPITGAYKLELVDAAGTVVDSATIQATGNAQVLTVRAPASAPTNSEVQKVVFSGPPNAAVQVQAVTFTLPDQLVPTSTP